MRKILFIQLAALSLVSGYSYADFSNANAKCPATLSHDDARAIAYNQPTMLSNPSYAVFKPHGDMANQVVKKGTSHAYTEPTLVGEKTLPSSSSVASIICDYKYSGKVTGRDFNFQIDVPTLNLRR